MVVGLAKVGQLSYGAVAKWEMNAVAFAAVLIVGFDDCVGEGDYLSF